MDKKSLSISRLISAILLLGVASAGLIAFASMVSQLLDTEARAAAYSRSNFERRVQELPISEPLRRQAFLEDNVSMIITDINEERHRVVVIIQNNTQQRLRTGYMFMLEIFDGEDWRWMNANMMFLLPGRT